MSKKKARGRSRVAMATPSHRALVSIALVLILLAGAGIAQWASIVSLGQKPNDENQKIAPQSFNPGTPAKEYIYAGGRLVATEEPAGCSGGITASTNLTATASSVSAVNLTWTAFNG